MPESDGRLFMKKIFMKAEQDRIVKKARQIVKEYLKKELFTKIDKKRRKHDTKIGSKEIC